MTPGRRQTWTASGPPVTISAMDDAPLREVEPPDEFDTYTLVVLRRGDDPPQLSDEEGARLQRQHLGHLETLRDMGAAIAAGPFADQPDETWRGLVICRTGLEETRALVARDPAVLRGRLRADVFTWYTRKGALPVPSEFFTNT